MKPNTTSPSDDFFDVMRHYAPKYAPVNWRDHFTPVRGALMRSYLIAFTALFRKVFVTCAHVQHVENYLEYEISGNNMWQPLVLTFRPLEAHQKRLSCDSEKVHELLWSNLAKYWDMLAEYQESFPSMELERVEHEYVQVSFNDPVNALHLLGVIKHFNGLIDLDEFAARQPTHQQRHGADPQQLTLFAPERGQADELTDEALPFYPMKIFADAADAKEAVLDHLDWFKETDRRNMTPLEQRHGNRIMAYLPYSFRYLHSLVNQITGLTSPTQDRIFGPH